MPEEGNVEPVVSFANGVITVIKIKPQNFPNKALIYFNGNNIEESIKLRTMKKCFITFKTLMMVMMMTFDTVIHNSACVFARSLQNIVLMV